ncbi:sigma-54 interaction domain-containing protein [Alkaliphilus crotonatoxidans]
MRRANVTHLNYTKGSHEDTAVFSYRQLFHQVLDGILIIGSTGRVEYINPAYERMFGVSNFAVVGKTIYQIPNDDIILTSMKNKRKIQGYIKLPFHHKKISATASPLMDQQQFQGLLAIYREESLGEAAGPKDQCQCSNQRLLAPFDTIVGNSKIMREALTMACKAARTQSTVLIMGESGTGKEMVAKAIHEAGPRATGPFVKVNCGAIPSNLLESELFGHEQGAFTGAIRRKIGKFELANGGTIFLDEIGDMPIDMQVKLLRVLQEKEFERVGGNETIQCNLRIIAATHRDLQELIREGQFREDLYYRLNVVPVNLPPLRERIEDIADLCHHFMEKIKVKTGLSKKKFDQSALTAFSGYHWPGNVRELENLMERLMVLVDGEEITLDDLPSHISHTYRGRFEPMKEHSLVNMSHNGEIATMDEYEREIIKKALAQFGSFNRAAKALGITHKTVAFKARKYEIVD